MKIFFRSQFAASLATVVDFGFLTFFVEILHGHYLVGVALGAFLGALTNFLVNRYWAFDTHLEKTFARQARRYFMVSAMSLVLNVFGVFVFTEIFKLVYLQSKICTALVVALFWNYPMHRHYVFPRISHKT